MEKTELQNDILNILRNIILNIGDIQDDYFTEQFFLRKDISETKLKLAKNYNEKLKKINI